MTAHTLARPEAADGLLNRYMLPRVALVVISIASLTGTYLTMTTHGANVFQAAVRWLHLVALGTLAGGTMWWGFFLQPPAAAEERADVARFAVAQHRRFRSIARIALGGAVLTAPHLLWLAGPAPGGGAALLRLANVAALGLALGSAALLVAREPVEARAFERGTARLTLATACLTLILTAVLDAFLTFPASPLAWLIRPLHLVAFGLWFGGAVWNIFIAVPGAQETLTLPVVIAGALQLERFRWAVRAILPALLVTGLIQAVPYTGLDVAALFLSPFGRLILFKLGLIVALVVIFLTCPMWRACSPIRGICDLEDLQTRKPVEPAARLDNRGKSCAGFVHIRGALDALQPGELFELLSSDPISWWELPAWLEKHGHTLQERERSGRLWWRTYRYLIRKGAPEQARPEARLVAQARAERSEPAARIAVAPGRGAPVQNEAGLRVLPD